VTQTQQLVVLIIDDDALAIRKIEAYCASSGYRPKHVAPTSAGPEMILPLQPDLILLKVLPAALDGALAVCHALTTHLPLAPVIMYGAAPDTSALQQSMAAGARRFLTAPFSRETLLRAISETRAQTQHAPSAALPATVAAASTPASVAGVEDSSKRGKLITVFSPKGGVGTTTLAVNLAVGLRARGKRTVLVDANITCGNVGVFLNINPKSSILELVLSGYYSDPRMVAGHLLQHQQTGLSVLLSPLQPEQSELVTPDHLRAVLTALQDQFDYVIVDTAASYEERVLAVLEMATTIMVPVAPDLAAVRNLTAFLRVSKLLGHDPEKVQLVLMRANSVPPAHVKEIENYLSRPFDHHVVSDGRRATEAINEGTPVVLRHRESRLATDLLALVDRLEGPLPTAARANAPRRTGWKGGLFATSSGQGTERPARESVLESQPVAFA